MKIKIFDKREAKVVQTFDGIHKRNIFEMVFFTPKLLILDWINCVRWSPSRDMLATASNDRKVSLLDFKTGKVLYTEKTSDDSKLNLIYSSILPILA